MVENELAASLVEREQELAQMLELEDALTRARADNQRLRRELQVTQAVLSDLTQSSSWRLTAPLRSLAAAARALPGRGRS